MKGKLAVAAAFDLQCLNNVQSRCAQHLIFLIGKSDSRSNDNAVAGVNANGVEVFH